MSKYTQELHEIIADGVNIWNFSFTLSNLTEAEITQLKDMFERHYYFREIGLETPALFCKYLENRWIELCYKYYKLFGIYKDSFTGDDLYANNSVESESQATFLDTPQSPIVTEDMEGYATNVTKASGSTKGLNNKTKYEVQREYADKLRFIMTEMIQECEPLFMQIF